MTGKEALACVLAFGGLVGMITCIVYMVRGASYETTRPWAGLQQRARTRKDGSAYVQTYYSKGPAVTKATLSNAPKPWFWLFFVAFWAGMFIR